MDQEMSVADAVADGDLMFAHPDETSAIDEMTDPLGTIAPALFAAGPVIHGKGHDEGRYVEFAGRRFPNILAPASMCTDDVFLAVSFAAQQEVMRNPDTFSSKLFEQSVGVFWGPSLAPMDPPEHTKYREVIQLAFMPKLMRTYEETIVVPMLKRRFADLKSKGRGDLVRELNTFYPYEIVGAIVGYEPEDIDLVGSLFYKIFQANSNPMAALEAGQKLREYTKNLVDMRREEPKDDLVSAIVQAEVDGKPITADHLVGMVNHLMAAGVDTTYRQTNNTIHCLLSNPDQFAKMKEDRSLIPAAVNEALRYEGLGGILPRVAQKDTELFGVNVPSDSVVFVMQSVGSRDPERWDNPHSFDIERKQKPHMQFVFGPHACVGQQLARLMLSRYLEFMLDELPNLRWDPEAGDPPAITGWTQRSALSLPVVWDT